MPRRKVLRAVAIAGAVAGIGGFGIGFAVGKTEDPANAPQARRLPADLCDRLGDVTVLFPSPVKLSQTGIGEVRCTAVVSEAAQRTYSGAELSVTIQTFAPQPGSTSADVARDEFDDESLTAMPGRPYPTKLRSSSGGEDDWRVEVLTTRGDLVVRVQYKASPITRQAAETAATTMADKAVWEAR